MKIIRIMFNKDLFRKKSIAQLTDDATLTEHESHHKLNKHLRARDLTVLGIAAIIGAGIFSTIGKASSMGGPGVIFLFIFTALACSFAAFAYAEFASIVPVSGSAYTYSYVSFGELFAWIIGWALIMEYAIGNITVAISWSDYFTSLINNTTPWHIPEWLTMDFKSARNEFHIIQNQLIANNATIESLTKNVDFVGSIDGYYAWLNAPKIGSFHIVFDLPAILITFLITALVYRGIRESQRATNAFVLIKVIVVITVIVVGSFYVNTENWDPFLPNGISGLLGGVSSVFFAYIGFDAISTTAEECVNPQEDMPKGIMTSIVICTILYVMVALVITGMVSYKELNVGDPLAYVFDKFSSLRWLSNVIAVSAVVAIASVMIVYQLGQPRIWLTMSRDGLLPKAFSKIHPKFKTPSFATIVTGLMVGVPTLFLDLSFVIDVCSLGTLFAFVLVCAGVLKLDAMENPPARKFKTPYFNGKYIVPISFLILIFCLFYFIPDWSRDFFSINNFNEKIPMFIFFILYLIVSYLSFVHSFSTIPVFGLLSCFYMMAQLHITNWIWFTVWLIIGLIIYFGYSRYHSKLADVK